MLVQFPRHRLYDIQRVEANDAVMGLLAGSKLAESVLRLTEGSSHRLAELFPKVPHVNRLNLKTEHATHILSTAENHLGGLAIPYMLSIHEDYMAGLCEMLDAEGKKGHVKLKDVGPVNMHEWVEHACGSNFNAETLELFHLLRLTRNAQIHNGGRVHRALAAYMTKDLSAHARTIWERVAGIAFPTYSLDEELALSVFQLVGTFAISKRLAEEANDIVHMALSRETWLKICIDDWADFGKSGNPSQRLRHAKGFARMTYGSLSFTENEITEELVIRGLI